MTTTKVAILNQKWSQSDISTKRMKTLHRLLCPGRASGDPDSIKLEPNYPQLPALVTDNCQDILPTLISPNRAGNFMFSGKNTLFCGILMLLDCPCPLLLEASEIFNAGTVAATHVRYARLYGTGHAHKKRFWRLATNARKNKQSWLKRLDITTAGGNNHRLSLNKMKSENNETSERPVLVPGQW